MMTAPAYLRMAPLAPRTTLPTVLTGRLIEGLSAVNAVERRLRTWEIEIIDRRIDSTPPQITIRRDPTRSLRPLYDAAEHGVCYLRHENRPTQAVCVVDGVALRWEV